MLDKAEARKELRKRIKAVQIAKDGFKLSPRQGVDHDAEKALGDLDRAYEARETSSREAVL